MKDVSEESLLDYFFSTGGNSGRVKNADILKTFKPYIGHSDLQLRAKYREEFKLIIDRIALVKSENGEKYLILKKKYRQQLQERESRAQGGDGSPASSTDSAPVHTAPWDNPQTPPTATEQTSTREEPMECVEPEGAATESKEEQLQESESEQDEESTGSMGSASVALDPVEKEWIYSAAGARVPDLSHLLRQDPTLANKKDVVSETALHWAAKHGNKDMATLVAEAGADVNTKSVSGYTPLHIAALHGHRHILDLLVGTYGAKENLRDYSGHLALHYLNIKEPEVSEEECDIQFAVTQARERHRNRKLASLFSSKKKWGSAEELAPIEEERPGLQQLPLPPFRPRKFSR
ncbi:ankyrin repeat domain-containing protein SOWAHB [Periophthalmus magnuspinnatus]|uniref:ankyrin repeat domain-containing protein SOWAHB n=1 Tax=Periophthalmus magnuspinnatus TaxID=409849 RepID=UPI002436B99B|nr:ankyrin repeat domain-containing protein SOWAHB [Periophthalmus magnuspinnatus]